MNLKLQKFQTPFFFKTYR